MEDAEVVVDFIILRFARDDKALKRRDLVFESYNRFRLRSQLLACSTFERLEASICVMQLAYKLGDFLALYLCRDGHRGRSRESAAMLGARVMAIKSDILQL